MTLAPVLLFTFKRLDTLRNTVSALRKNYLAPDSDLFIFSDAARHAEEADSVNAVREYLTTIDGFKSVSIIEAAKNKGLANSIIDGVSNIIGTGEKVIVLEDDLLTTPNFLSFMNVALERYQLSKEVFSISGYAFNLGAEKPRNYPYDVYFTRRGWSWGWATWKDRWTGVDWKMTDYAEFSTNAEAQRKFAAGGSDLNAMLKKQMNGKLDSWAIRWFYHQYKTGGLSCYPIYSKVYNDGFDQFATHTTGSNQRYRPLLDTIGQPEFILPDQPGIHPYYEKRFQDKLSIRARLLSKSQNLLEKLLRP